MNTTTDYAVIGGCPVSAFVLPGISPEVPVKDPGDTRRMKILARLALIAEEAGWELPTNTELTVEQVLAAQLANYINKQYPGLGITLKAEIELTALDDKLHVTIGALRDLNIFRMKPIVLALEQVQTGLGWFVAKAATTISGDMNCYTPSIMTQGYDATFYWDLDGSFTDESYAKLIIDQWGDGDEDDDMLPDENGKMSETAIQRVRENYCSDDLWPSDISEEVEGNIHLAYSFSQLYPWPAITAGEAQQWFDANPGHELASVVSDALQLLNQKDHLDGSFVWDNSDDEECIGAMAFIVWDSAYLTGVAAERHEIAMMESGVVGEEAIGRYTQNYEDEPTDEQLKAIIMATNNYLERWNLAEKLVSNFPKME